MGCSIKVTEAILSRDVSLLGEILDDEENGVDQVLHNGQTPLGFAVCQERLEVVEFLLRRGADVHKNCCVAAYNPCFQKFAPPGKVSPLQLAVETQNPRLLEMLLRHGASPEHSAGGLKGLICLSVHLKAASLVDFLVSLAKHRDMCIVPSLDLTVPLVGAVKQGDVRMVKQLLDLGARVNGGLDGVPPLVHAADSGNLRMCLALVNHGARTNAGSQLGAARPPLAVAVMAGLENAVAMLMMLGSDPNGQAYWSRGRPTDPISSLDEGSTVMHVAAAAAPDLAVIRKLVSAGGRLWTPNLRGDTPLHLFCRAAWLGARSERVLQYLLDPVAQEYDMRKVPGTHHYVDKNTRNSNQMTALMVATEAKNVEAVKQLLAAGVRTDTKDQKSNSALYYAVSADSEEATLALLRAGCEVNGGSALRGITPLHLAIQNKNWTLAEILLDFYADILILTRRQESVMHLTVAANGDEFIHHFLDKKFLVNFADVAGVTPLMLAARDGHLEICRQLVFHDALLNARDKRGSTALLICACHCRLDLAVLLVGHGADVNLANHRNNFPLLEAVRCGQTDMVRLLIHAGADLRGLAARHVVPTTPPAAADTQAAAAAPAAQGAAAGRPAAPVGPAVALWDGLSLQAWSRITIRRRLCSRGHGYSIHNALRKLSLPMKLVSYMLFEEFFSAQAGSLVWGEGETCADLYRTSSPPPYL